MLSPDVLEPNIVLVQGGNFLLQVAAEQAHEEVHLAAWALLPVLFRKCVKSERGNFHACGSFYSGAHRCDSGAMPGYARQMSTAGPAPVSVHNNGDVFREPRWIQPQVNFRFLAVQPGRNCYLQANLFCCLKLTQRKRCVQ